MVDFLLSDPENGGGLADVTTTLGVTFEGYLDYEI